jgi:hypothetical protein
MRASMGRKVDEVDLRSDGRGRRLRARGGRLPRPKRR